MYIPMWLIIIALLFFVPMELSLLIIGGILLFLYWSILWPVALFILIVYAYCCIKDTIENNTNQNADENIKS